MAEEGEQSVACQKYPKMSSCVWAMLNDSNPPRLQVSLLLLRTIRYISNWIFFFLFYLETIALTSRDTLSWPDEVATNTKLL